MDILLFAALIGMSSAFIGIDFWKRAPYFGVLGGIILILLGIYLSVDNSFTMLVCGLG